MFCNKLIYSESLLIETSAYRQWRDRVLLLVNHGQSNDTMSVFVKRSRASSARSPIILILVRRWF